MPSLTMALHHHFRFLLQPVPTSSFLTLADIGRVSEHPATTAGAMIQYPRHDDIHHELAAYTIMTYAKSRVATVAANETPISHAGGGADPWQTARQSSDDWRCEVTSTTASYQDTVTDGLLSGGRNDPQRWNLMGGTWTDDLLIARINYDKGSGTATVGVTDNGLTANNQVHIGGDSTGSTATWDGWIAYGAMWDRALTDPEWNSVVKNPWSLFEPQTIWIPEGAAAGVVITVVDTDDTWDDGDTGLIATGTGFI